MAIHLQLFFLKETKMFVTSYSLLIATVRGNLLYMIALIDLI